MVNLSNYQWLDRMTQNMKYYSIRSCESDHAIVKRFYLFLKIFSPFILSYKTIDRNSFFVIPEKLESIAASSADLERTIEVNWPCSREEEVRNYYEV